VLSYRLEQGDRLEFRGFGSFFIKRRAPKDARNPGTNEIVKVPERYVPVFKPSKILRDRVDKSNKKGKF
ncbi:integration host factor subunit beta, partial [bacterium]|nr:integration host factor subunit beta [bacterium]